MTRLNPEWTDHTGLTLYRSMQHLAALAMLRAMDKIEAMDWRGPIADDWRRRAPEQRAFWEATAISFASA